ncbi:MAG: hypothetical protein ACI9LE_002271, partial [Paraglaciecola sp.]
LQILLIYVQIKSMYAYRIDKEFALFLPQSKILP